MKFKVVETKKMSAKQKLLKHLDQKEQSEKAKDKKYAEKEKERKDKDVKESTLSGAGFPGSNKSVDKAPTDLTKKKGKRKRMIKRVLTK